MIFKHTVMVTLLVSAIGVLTAQTLPQQPSTATQVTPLLPEAAEPVTKEVSFKESWQTISLQDSGLLLDRWTVSFSARSIFPRAAPASCCICSGDR